METHTLIDNGILKQHLIDPEICIRCNTCEATCPVNAITHDDNNYVVRADVCNGCMACISPCPTGSIDNWRAVPLGRAYSIEEQFSWEELPGELAPHERVAAGAEPATAAAAPQPAVGAPSEPGTQVFRSAQYGATVPPWSAAHPYTNLFPPKNPTTATVVGNFNCTEAGFESETHHVVLEFGSMPFPVLEGQSIGIIPPGVDALGKPHHARQYSAASPRNGERPGYNNLALTVKRVTVDHDGNPVRGVASNYVCDKGGRQGASGGAVRQQLPHAQPPAIAHRDDLYRHRQRSHARHDRVAAQAAQQRQV